MSFDVLQDKIRAMKNPTVAGLDARIEYVPEYIRQAAFEECGVGLKGAAEAIYQFNVGLIDALCDIVPAVKPQSAYYENLGSGDDPFSYIKVIPLIGADAQIKCGGFDHAGKWETSLLMGTYPELVDLSRCKDNTEWFAQSAKEASEELGHHMVNCTLEWLREAIV